MGQLPLRNFQKVIKIVVHSTIIEMVKEHKWRKNKQLPQQVTTNAWNDG
jgi:hypothetical protein